MGQEFSRAGQAPSQRGRASEGSSRRLVFVSPRFLFPVDSGGKIRTTQILRGMKCSGEFEITLVSPASATEATRYRRELATVCDRFVSWTEQAGSRLRRILRGRHIVSLLPISVASDRSAAGRKAVAKEVDRCPDVVVFDFAHSAVLAPARLSVPSVLFTHNVESEIFARHAQVAKHVGTRILWKDQLRKMERFERAALARFDAVVAVSERDRSVFAQRFGRREVAVIPTGVDLEYFSYEPPQPHGDAIFTGSMDWLANIDGVGWLLDEVWPRLERRLPRTAMKVIGRAPPQTLRTRAVRSGYCWQFTGYVEDVRPHAHGASVFVIPLRVGGGTRLKVFEAMAMGVPIVSTALGVEGLPLEEGRHYLGADSAEAFAHAVARLMEEPALAQRISQDARALVEREFSFEVAALAFEQICLRVAERHTGQRADTEFEAGDAKVAIGTRGAGVARGCDPGVQG